jgi:GT2 family glycosyltransferase
MSPTGQPPGLGQAEPGVDFSVVLATRNRGPLLERALESVLLQADVSLQVLVVDDGSHAEHEAQVAAAVALAAPRAQLLRLAARAAGHGPSFARNTAATHARGRYIAFLDDDDHWDDPGHLARCLASMSAGPQPADLLFGNQRALRPDGSEHTGDLWLRALPLQGPADAQGAHATSVSALLALGAMCHLNTTVIGRALFEAIGGFDERLRYEEDRDLCLRAIDRATRILYQPRAVGLHYVPDAARRDNASTTLGEIDKRLAQLLMYDKAQLVCQRPECRRYASQAKAQVLRRVAQHLADASRHREAQHYRWQVLATDFNTRWLGHTLIEGIRRFGASP